MLGHLGHRSGGSSHLGDSGGLENVANSVAVSSRQQLDHIGLPCPAKQFLRTLAQQLDRRRPSRDRPDVMGLISTALGSDSKGTRPTFIMPPSAVAGIVGLLI